MDEPMIVSVVGSQDALWEADEFWEEEKPSPESTQSVETETSLLDAKNIKTEPSSFYENHIKTENPVYDASSVKTEPSYLDKDCVKQEDSYFDEEDDLKLADKPDGIRPYCNNSDSFYCHDLDSKPQREVLHEKDISIVDVAFVCGVCKCRFESEDACKKHIEAEHEEKPVEEDPPPKPSLKSYRIHPSSDDLKRKSDTPTEAVAEKSVRTDNSTVNGDKPAVAQRATNMTQVLCGTCGARFFHQKTLSRHMQNQHGVRETLTTVTFTALLYACDFCGAKFSRYRTMLDHYKSEHKTIEVAPIDMPCLTCDEMFKSYKQLEEHVQNKDHALHWFCFLCEQKFPKDLEFRNHICPKTVSSEFVQDWKKLKLVCPTCSKIYYGRKFFSKHVSRCGFKDTCKECNEAFDNLRDWFHHKQDCGDVQVIDEVHPTKS